MRLAKYARTAALITLATSPCARLAAQTALTSPSTLDRTLHVLYVAAAVLGVLLLLVAGLAYAAYRRNGRGKLTPNGTDDSAR